LSELKSAFLNPCRNCGVKFIPDEGQRHSSVFISNHEISSDCATEALFILSEVGSSIYKD